MMNVFPNSGNVSLYLLKAKLGSDRVGNQLLELLSSKQVVGSASSITSKEFYSSLQSKVQVDLKVSIPCILYSKHKYVYIPREDTIYKVERTYLNGMNLELYLSSTSIHKEEVKNWNLLN